jgi:hypothetical protein
MKIVAALYDVLKTRFIAGIIFLVLILIWLGVYLQSGRTLHGATPEVRTGIEIAGIEMAMTRLMADAGVNHLSDIVNQEALFHATTKVIIKNKTAGIHAAEAAVYSHACYALLQSGRNANETLRDNPATRYRIDLLQADRLENLADHYLDIETDPWGNPYHFYPGPWPESEGPIPFRIRVPSSDYEAPLQADLYTVIAHASDGIYPVGFPADPDKKLFIWSCGANGASDQLDAQRSADRLGLRYRADANGDALGGGDDINNWDPYRSWRSIYKYRRLIDRWWKF